MPEVESMAKNMSGPSPAEGRQTGRLHRAMRPAAKAAFFPVPAAIAVHHMEMMKAAHDRAAAARGAMAGAMPEIRERPLTNQTYSGARSVQARPPAEIRKQSSKERALAASAMRASPKKGIPLLSHTVIPVMTAARSRSARGAALAHAV